MQSRLPQRVRVKTSRPVATGAPEVAVGAEGPSEPLPQLLPQRSSGGNVARDIVPGPENRGGLYSSIVGRLKYPGLQGRNVACLFFPGPEGRASRGGSSSRATVLRRRSAGAHSGPNILLLWPKLHVL